MDINKVIYKYLNHSKLHSSQILIHRVPVQNVPCTIRTN